MSSNAECILVVDDEEDLANLVIFHLERNGFKTLKALNGKEAIELAARSVPSLVILDLMLPDIDGLEVFRTIRRSERTARVPIIMLTARGEEVDRVVGLELGADDYVTKPFSTRELILRVKTILRRSVPAEASEATLSFGPVRIDSDRFEVSIGGESKTLTSTEFRLLRELMQRRGRVLTRQYLLEVVWGQMHNVTDRTVDTHIKRLRRKIGPLGAAYVETVRGVGYRFADSERSPSDLVEDDDDDDDLEL